jgi:mannosyltransferase
LQRRKGGSNRSWQWQILGITVLAAGIRFYHIGVPALWTDEAYSLWFAKLSLPDVWLWTVRIDPHPPLYYVLLHFWSMLGQQEGVLRSLSALCGTLTVPLVYLLGRTINGHRLGLLAAIFFTLSPFNLWYDQEARMYPLLALSTTMAMLGLAVLLRWPRASDLLRAKKPLLAGWILYVIGMVVALWSQHSAMLLFLLANVLMLSFQSRLHLKPTFIYSWLGTQLVIAALWSPVLWILVGQVFAGNPEAVPKVGAGIFLSVLVADVGFLVTQSLSSATRVLAISGIELACILIGFGLWSWRRQPRWLFFTLSLWLGPVLAEGIASLFWQPLLVPRTLIWTLVPFYVMLARGILRVRPASVGAIALIFLLIIDIGAIGLYYARPSKWEEWDRAAAYVDKHVHPEDIVLFHDNMMQLPFDYYFRRYRRRVAERGVPVDFPYGKTREPVMTPADLPRLHRLVGNHPRVWLVYSHEWFTDPIGSVPLALGRLGHLADLQTFVGAPRIRVYLFEMNRPAYFRPKVSLRY